MNARIDIYVQQQRDGMCWHAVKKRRTQSSQASLSATAHTCDAVIAIDTIILQLSPRAGINVSAIVTTVAAFYPYIPAQKLWPHGQE